MLFAFRLRGGFAEVREGGATRKRTKFAAGDTLEIRITRGVVRYLKNGSVLYTSSRAARYPLQVDSALLTAGATLRGAQIKRGS